MMGSRDVADTDIFEYVNALSSEEERLYQKAGDGSGLSDAERDRLQAINVELDRCYDLLHQRQGRRDADRDPSGATLRSARTVEGYEQ
jgi:hypothetical protein